MPSNSKKKIPEAEAVTCFIDAPPASPGARRQSQGRAPAWWQVWERVASEKEESGNDLRVTLLSVCKEEEGSGPPYGLSATPSIDLLCQVVAPASLWQIRGGRRRGEDIGCRNYGFVVDMEGSCHNVSS